jgi:hypothetical protein
MNEGMSVFSPLLAVANYGVTFTLTFISRGYSVKFIYVIILGFKRLLLLQQLQRAASNDRSEEHTSELQSR